MWSIRRGQRHGDGPQHRQAHPRTREWIVRANAASADRHGADLGAGEGRRPPRNSPGRSSATPRRTGRRKAWTSLHHPPACCCARAAHRRGARHRHRLRAAARSWRKWCLAHHRRTSSTAFGGHLRIAETYDVAFSLGDNLRPSASYRPSMALRSSASWKPLKQNQDRLETTIQAASKAKPRADQLIKEEHGQTASRVTGRAPFTPRPPDATDIARLPRPHHPARSARR